MKTKNSKDKLYFNSGYGPNLSVVEIGLDDQVGVLEPDLAFWSIIPRSKLSEKGYLDKLAKKLEPMREDFAKEIDTLRFGLKPSAVYFNPTERCNLNCDYCYLPSKMRKTGKHMTAVELLESLKILRAYFRKILPKGRIPQLVFHGSEPLLVKDVIFEGIEKYHKDFSFGVQTNATLLDQETFDFLSKYKVGIGISIDGHNASIANKTRRTWKNEGTFKKVLNALDILEGYPHLNAICTVTSDNYMYQEDVVDFMHDRKIPVGMLNYVRCTRPGGYKLKAENQKLAKYYIKALDKTYKLYEKTGRKLIIANFANIILSLVAPSARRLMCDISPCGGGRVFFAVSAKGDLFPCSEFVGMENFCGGNLFKDSIPSILKSKPFNEVTGRLVENIEPCSRCAVKHFCGAPCPAEVYGINKKLDAPSEYCEFFEEQVRYSLRLIAQDKHEAYLYDDWKKDTTTSFSLKSL